MPNDIRSDSLRLPRDVRREMTKEIDKLFKTLGAKLVITFDSHAIQIIIFPPNGETFKVPGGPYLVTAKDGQIQEE